MVNINLGERKIKKTMLCRSRMGEEENELEGGVYGGENFLNNVRNADFYFAKKYLRCTDFDNLSKVKYSF